MSDFHKLTFTVLKQHFPKEKPKVVIHRHYKNFRNDYFRIELENALLKYNFNNIDYDNFIKTFLTVLDKHAPIKEKYLRANHANFEWHSLKSGLETCDPGPWNPRPGTLGPGTRGSGPWDPRPWDLGPWNWDPGTLDLRSWDMGP